MTPPHDDHLLDDLERLARPDRFWLAIFSLDGALTRMVPRGGEPFPGLREADGTLWSCLGAQDAAAARALLPGQTLERGAPTERPTGSGPGFGVTLLRRRGDFLLVGIVGAGVDDQVLDRLTQLNNETLNLYRELAKRKAELEEAMSHIRVLRGLLPICSSCKKIRNDEGAWDDLESYIHDHSEAEFSHGLCPTCLKALFPDDC